MREHRPRTGPFLHTREPLLHARKSGRQQIHPPGIAAATHHSPRGWQSPPSRRPPWQAPPGSTPRRSRGSSPPTPACPCSRSCTPTLPRGTPHRTPVDNSEHRVQKGSTRLPTSGSAASSRYRGRLCPYRDTRNRSNSNLTPKPTETTAVVIGPLAAGSRRRSSMGHLAGSDRTVSGMERLITKCYAS